MTKIKVGDSVKLKPGVYTSHTEYDKEALCFGGYYNGALPDVFVYKEEYTVLSVYSDYSEYAVLDMKNGHTWQVRRDAVELVPTLSKEERFAKSKHRVETRHLRKKCDK